MGSSSSNKIEIILSLVNTEVKSVLGGIKSDTVNDIAQKIQAGSGDAKLAKDFDAAKKAAQGLKQSLTEQQGQLYSLKTAMTSAGLSTSNLYGQQVKLARQLDVVKTKYQQAAAVAGARIDLGLVSHKDIESQINRLKASYATLASSGKLSMAELAQAKFVLGNRIDELREKTNGWKSALAGSIATMAELAAAAAPTVLAIRQAITFETSVAQMAKVIDAPREKIAALRTELLHMTRELPLTANELAAIAAAGGQLGVKTEDIGKFVSSVAKMSTAFDMTAQDAGVAIGKLKNVYQLGMDDVNSLGDAINKLGNTSAARERDIVDTMVRIGGTARQFGLAKEQAAALAAAMLSLGKTPETASTAINALLSKTQTATKQSKEFQAALSNIGMSANDLAAAIEKGPQQALDMLLEKLSGLKGRERAETLTDLFGMEYQDDIAVLVGSLDGYRSALGQVDAAHKYSGAMQQEFEKRAKTTENQLKLTQNAVSEVGISLGTVFLPAINAVLGLLKNGLNGLANMTEAAPKLSAAMSIVATGFFALGPATKLVNILRLGVVNMATSSISVLSGMVAGLRGMAAGMSTASIAAGGLKSAIGAMAGVFLAWEAGWQIGTWLNQFDSVKRAGVKMAEAMTLAWLKAKEAWAKLTGGDVAAATADIDQAKIIYGEMYKEIGQKAQEAGKEQANAHQSAATSAATSASKIKQVTGEALDALKKKYQEYAAEVRRLQDQIAGRERSLAEELRAMARTGMTDYSAWKDRKKEAEEYAAAAKKAAEAARQAAAAGDKKGAETQFATALEYADKAKEAYKDLNKEVKDGDKVMVSGTEALKTAMDGVKSSGELATDILKQQQEALHGYMDELTKQSGFQDLTKGMDEFDAAWIKSWQDMRAKAVSEIATVEDKLTALTKDREVTVWINEKVRKALGGPVGAFARGGKLSGYGGGDRIHALLEAGEFVIRKEAVRRFGSGVFHALNSLRLPELPRFADGGMVGAMAGGGGGESITINLTLPGSSTQARVRADRANADELLRQVARMKRLASS